MRPTVLVLVIALALVSCGAGDPELTAEIERLNARVAELENELAEASSPKWPTPKKVETR